MRIRQVRDSVLKTRVVVDPIARIMPLVEDVWKNWQAFAFFPYEGPYRDWDSYPVNPRHYPEYAELVYQLGYIGRIHFVWRGNKGVYRLVYKKRAKPEFQITPEQWIVYSSVSTITVEDLPQKRTFSFKEYEGKVLQSIWPARLAKIAFIRPSKTKDRFRKGDYYGGRFLEVNRHIYAQVLDERNTKQVNLYDKKIVASNQMTEVILAPLKFKFLVVNAENGVWQPVIYKARLASWINGSKKNALSWAKTNYFSSESAYRAISSLVKLNSIPGELESSIKSITFLNKKAKSGIKEESRSDLILANFSFLSFNELLKKKTNVVQPEITPLSSLLLEETKIRSILRKKGGIFTGSIPLVISHQVLSMSYYEDETAEVETQEFFADGDSPRDFDLFVSHFKGGTADYYKVIPYFGWDTNARNLSGTSVQYNRAKLEKGDTPQTSFRDFISAFSFIPFTGSVVLLGKVPSFLLAVETFKGDLSERQSFGSLLEGVSSSFRREDSAFMATHYLDEKELEFQPEFGILDSPRSGEGREFPIFAEEELIFGDLFLLRATSFKTIDQNLEEVKLDYISSFREEKSFADTHISLLGQERVSTFWTDGIDSLAKTEGISTFELGAIKQVDSLFKVSSAILGVETPVKAFSLYRISTLYDSFSQSAKTSFYSSFWSENTKKGSPDEDIWEPTETWADLRGEPATYFLTLAKYPVDKFYTLFKGKPISYIDIWQPYYIDANGNFVNLSEEFQRKGGYTGPYQGYSWIYNVWQSALSWRKKLTTKPLKTLIQTGWGYTTPPKVTIDANRLSQELKEDVLPIPQTLAYDILSDRVFLSGSIDTRDYYGPIVDRAKVEIRPFQEWVESIGAFAFVYGLTMHFHIINGMSFESQTFMGCAAKGLKIIGSMPKVPIP